MKRLLSGAVALTAIVLSAAPASAAHLTVDDPAGDASGRGLDITGATLRNLGHQVVVNVEFVRPYVATSSSASTRGTRAGCDW
ncbi:hypothetical protein [Nocardioides aquiterrae]|uniref:hypothetical protein n=1 Tax=Nocardioides aquiterrae TaxID=203799 RepID=UPI0031D6BE78